MEWVNTVDARRAREAQAVAQYVVNEIGTPPIHVCDALLISTECTIVGTYVTHNDLAGINFPLDLVPDKRISLPLFLFHVLLLFNLPQHYTWVCQLVRNLERMVTHRPYTDSEKAIVQVMEWFYDITDVACVVSCVHGTRPDIDMVVSHAAHALYLAYGSRANVQHAIVKATATQWELHIDTSFYKVVRQVVQDAQIVMAGVESTSTPLVLVDGQNRIGLVCCPTDKVLLLFLLLFSQWDISMEPHTGVPPCLTGLVKTLKSLRTEGAHGTLPFHHGIAQSDSSVRSR